MPVKIQPPASFSKYHPELSLAANEQLQTELLADFAHMCRCSVCEKKPGLFYQECCSRILCDWCHVVSKCDGHNHNYPRQQPQETPLPVKQEQIITPSLWAMEV